MFIASSARFIAPKKMDDAYVITFDEIDKKIEETIALGGTQILMQGGHHPNLPSSGIWICCRILERSFLR